MALRFSRNIEELIQSGKLVLSHSNIKTSINLDEITDSDELISRLASTNSLGANKERDIESIKRYLELRRMGYPSMHYYFEGPGENMDITKASRYDGGSMISGDFNYSQDELINRGVGDYRITMRGSSKTTTEEALAFVDAFTEEANNRGLTVRLKDQWTHDAVILYIKQDDLLSTVRMLEDLKNDPSYGTLVNEATRHFGPVMPFSATLSKDSYYGIAMAHSEGKYGRESSRLRGSYGGNFGNTFGSYIEEECLHPVYDALMEKYHGDSSRITATEMYNGVVEKHKMYMLGDFNIDIPLWMNRRNYKDYKKKKEMSIEERNGFRRATDLDLDGPSSVHK